MLVGEVGRAVGVHHNPEAAVEQVLAGGDDVGEPADHTLEPLVGVGHHLAVQSQTGHHQERLFAGAVVDHADVQRTLGAGQQGLDGVLERGGRQAEVAGQQVAGAAGQQPERGLGVQQPGRDGAHGSVATQGRDHVRPGRRGRAGLALTRVILGGLDHVRLGPAVPRAGVGEGGADRVQVVDLGGVHDDGQTW